MRVLLAHPGIQHAPRLARELERLGLLDSFWTGIAIGESGAAARIARSLRAIPPLGGLSNRIVRGVPSNRLHRVPLVEIRALARLKCGRDSLQTLHERNERFQRAVPVEAIRAASATIGFDTSSWILAEHAGAEGKPFFLDRTIAHPAAFARIEAELHRRFPDWCDQPSARPAWLAEAEAAEHRLAHRISVGGSFARDTLVAEGIDPARIVVNPYGVDWTAFGASSTPRAPSPRRPFRFLFLGSVTARKGVPLLIAAWRAIDRRRGDAELWIAGPAGARERKLIPDLPGLRAIGAVPHADVPSLLGQADVFVLPSYFEGFGLVLLEALAAGLPFISTSHTGAADLPEDPRLGTRVDVGSLDALVAAMESCLRSPPDRDSVRAACLPLQPIFSWEAYGNRWQSILSTP